VISRWPVTGRGELKPGSALVLVSARQVGERLKRRRESDHGKGDRVDHNIGGRHIAGRDDGPGKGLGEGGERLHYWVFGGPWNYDDEVRGEPSGEALEFLNRATARTGAIVVGRWMYEAAGHWGDKNPWDIPVFVVTHRREEEPETGEFSFVGGFDEAIERAREVAGDKDVAIGGGADVIRQELDGVSSTSSRSSSRL